MFNDSPINALASTCLAQQWHRATVRLSNNNERVDGAIAVESQKTETVQSVLNLIKKSLSQHNMQRLQYPLLEGLNEYTVPMCRVQWSETHKICVVDTGSLCRPTFFQRRKSIEINKDWINKQNQ